jgi:hypothetical protein
MAAVAGYFTVVFHLRKANSNTCMELLPVMSQMQKLAMVLPCLAPFTERFY